MIFIAEFLKSDWGLILSFILTSIGLVVSIISLILTTTVKRAISKERRINTYNASRIDIRLKLIAFRSNIVDDASFDRHLLLKIRQTKHRMEISCYPIFKKSFMKKVAGFNDLLLMDFDSVDITMLVDYLDLLIAQLEIKGESL